MKPRVYVIPASPPCAAIEAALRLKGVPYDVTELPNVFHVVHQLARFRAATVPSMRLGDEKIVGSTRIMRRLERQWPDPPLYGRPGVEEAEAWADDTFQRIGRVLVWWSVSHHVAAMPSFVEQARIPFAQPMARVSGPVASRLGRLRNGAGDDAARAELAALPGYLERIEGWIDAGVIGTEEPTAADLQIGSVLALLLNLEDVARVIAPHERVVALSRRWFPDHPGRVPAGVLPAAWLPSGTSTTA